MADNFRLKLKVAEINRELLHKGLVVQTWGNASALDRETMRVLIKSSGVPFENLNADDISEVDFEGRLYTVFKPSVDTPTHIEIYKAFEGVGGIVHTHSHYATVFSQAKMPIPCIGTTHADNFKGDIPLIPDLAEEEIRENYEEHTGKKIVSYFKENKINHLDIPAALIPNHGVFVWGETLDKALENSIILEKIAKMAYETIFLLKIHGKEPDISKHLLEKHFSRKHGPNKYYGQEK